MKKYRKSSQEKDQKSRDEFRSRRTGAPRDDLRAVQEELERNGVRNWRYGRYNDDPPNMYGLLDVA